MINDLINSKLDTFVDHPTFYCNVIGCRDDNHRLAIDRLYSFLSTIVVEASESFSNQYIRRDKYKVIPGWNRNVKNLHKLFREKYLCWVRSQKELHTTEHENMLSSRKSFKRALDMTKSNEHKEACQSIAEKF